MSLSDSLKKAFNRKTVRAFQEFIRNNRKALSIFTDKQFDDSLVMEDFNLWRKYSSISNQKLINSIISKKFNYSQMEAIVENRETILKLYELRVKFEEEHNRLKRLCESYPQAIKELYYEQGGRSPFYCEGLNRKEVVKLLKFEKDFPRLEVLITKFHEIKEKNPSGVKTFLEKNPRITYEKIVESESQIILLEQYAKKAEEYDKWEKEQAEFAKECRLLKDDLLKEFGCRLYDLNFSKINKYGNETKGKYSVWQLYHYAFCSSINISYKHVHYLNENYDSSKQIKKNVNIFSNEDYQLIIDYINHLAEKKEITVLFNDDIDGLDIWNAQQLYQRFKITNANYKFTHGIVHNDFSTAYTKSLNSHIIIVDMVTENDSLKGLCENIIETFKEKRPLITVVSMMKGYSEEEARALIERKEKEIEEKRKKEIEENFEKIVLDDEDRRNYYKAFCNENRLNEKEQKEYILNHIHQLDAYIPRAKRNKAQQLIDKTRSAGWENRCGGSFLTFSLYNYYPTTCEWEADADDWEIRYLIWHFKNSSERDYLRRVSRGIIVNSHIDYLMALDKIIPLVEKILKRTFGDDLSRLTLACIPASTKINTSRRYARFSERLCAETNMTNGYNYINILQEGQAKHLGGSSSTVIECEKDFFKDKFVLMFDDVITRGNSMIRFKRLLEDSGAYVIGGMSIGRTKHEKIDQHPIDKLGQTNSIDIEDDLPF